MGVHRPPLSLGPVDKAVRQAAPGPMAPSPMAAVATEAAEAADAAGGMAGSLLPLPSRTTAGRQHAVSQHSPAARRRSAAAADRTSGLRLGLRPGLRRPREAMLEPGWNPWKENHVCRAGPLAPTSSSTRLDSRSTRLPRVHRERHGLAVATGCPGSNVRCSDH